jgi:DNA invertase Pin-like site-specific DNA recombinase
MDGMTRTTKTAIYVRISLDQTGEGLGVARQRKECQALAGRLDWQVVSELRIVATDRWPFAQS